MKKIKCAAGENFDNLYLDTLLICLLNRCILICTEICYSTIQNIVWGQQEEASSNTPKDIFFVVAHFDKFSPSPIQVSELKMVKLFSIT